MIKKLLFLVGFIVLFCFSRSIVYAEEMHPIWDYNNFLFFERPTGEFGFRFMEESRQSSYDGKDGESRYRFFTEELRIEDNMFILRPRFLKLNFGFGVVFEQGGADYPSKGLLTDYKFRGEFLSGTPYSGSFFTEKQYKEYEHTPSSIYLMDMFRAGAGFRMGEEVMGWPINFNFKYSSRESENMFNEFNSFFKEGWKTFEADTKKEWDIFKLNFSSGITQYEREFVFGGEGYEAQSLNSYSHGSLFGKFLDDNLRTKTRVSLNSQSGINEYLNMKFGQDVNYWILQDKLQTLDAFLKFDVERITRDYSNVNDKEQNESGFFQTEENLMEIRIGFSHQLGISLSSELEGILSKLSLSNYESLLTGIRGKTDYTKVIPWRGKFSSGYAFEFNDIARSGDGESFIKGESRILSGYSPIALKYENVQIESVEVFDLSGVVHYLEGIDYRVYRAGPKTYIERIVGTSILNGEAVFVDYKNKNPLGDIIESSHTVSLGVSLLDGLMEPYVRFFILNQEANGPIGLTEENIFLNPGASYIIGIRSRNIFEQWWNIERESSIELEENTQELYPFQRLTFKSSLSVPLPFIEGLKVSLSNNRTSIKYNKESGNDYTLLSNAFNVLYETRKMKVASGVSYDASAIGDTDRKVLSLFNGVSYKLRRWTVDLFARQAFEEYVTGARSTENDGLLVKFYISRKF